MRILLDECLPLRLTTSLAFGGHQVDHVTQCGVGGLDDARLHEWAAARYQLFIASDRHFRKKLALKPTATMGIICIRIAPNTYQEIEPVLSRFLQETDITHLVAKLVVVWRDQWLIA